MGTRKIECRESGSVFNLTTLKLKIKLWRNWITILKSWASHINDLYNGASSVYLILHIFVNKIFIIQKKKVVINSFKRLMHSIQNQKNKLILINLQIHGFVFFLNPKVTIVLLNLKCNCREACSFEFYIDIWTSYVMFFSFLYKSRWLVHINIFL